jgi:hypothetical protein
MERNRRFTQSPDHRAKVLKMTHCAMCLKEFTCVDHPQGHHSFGRNWKRNCKDYETIFVDYRMIKLHGPSTDPTTCHGLAHAGANTDDETLETLLELVGDCALSDTLEKAGWIAKTQ